MQDQTSPGSEVAKAREAEATGRIEEALRAYQTMVERRFDDVNAWQGVLRNASRLGEDAVSLVAGRRLLELTEPDFELRARLARALLGEGRIDEARREIEEAWSLTQSDIDRAFVLVIRARLELAAGQRASALLSYQMAVGADSGNLDAQEGFIQALFDAGLIKPAEQQARLVLEDYPDAGAIWIQLALLLLKQDKNSEAIEALWRARVLLDEREIDVHLACAAGRLGRWSEVLEHVQSALSGPMDGNEWVRSQIFLALAFENAGELTTALEHLDTALSAGRLTDRVLYDLARLERKLYSTAHAIPRLYEAVRLQPYDEYLVLLYCWWLIEEGRAEDLLKFLSASPLRKQFRHFAILCEHLLGEDEAVLEEAWSYVKDEPASEMSWAALALALRTKDDAFPARAASEIAFSLAPGSEDARWFKRWPRSDGGDGEVPVKKQTRGRAAPEDSGERSESLSDNCVEGILASTRAADHDLSRRPSKHSMVSDDAPGHRAAELLAQGALEEAMGQAILDETVALSERDRSAIRVIRGEISALSGEHGEALLHYQTAIELDPWNVHAQEKLIWLLLFMGSVNNAAERRIRKSLTMMPEHGPYWHALGALLIACGRLDEAVDALGRACELSDDSEVYIELARVAVAECRWDDAVQHARAALARGEDPDSTALGHYYVAVALANLGCLDAAIAELRSAPEVSRLSDFLLYEIARVERLRGARDDALSAARAALQLRPDDKPTFDLLAQLLIELNRPADLLHAVSESPLAGSLEHYSVLCKALCGRVDQAVTQALENASCRLGDSIAWAAVGVAYRAAGETGRAGAAARLARAIDPDDQYVLWFEDFPENEAES